jgi:hypothetical protein
MVLISGIKRKRWTEEEELEFSILFGRQIEAKKNITSKDIRNAQRESKYLKCRSETMIRSKINNIILGKSKLQVHHNWDHDCV